MDTEEVTKLFRVQKTIIQMLKDRGYLVPDNYGAQSIEEFKDKYNNRKQMLVKVDREDKEDDSLLVIFFEDEKLSVSNIEEQVNYMVQRDLKRGILVLKIHQTIQKLAAIVYLEVFTQDDLLVNITQHELVPQHILISDQEKKKLMDKYQLPRIQQSDPVARYLGLQKGQVVKILRNSETAGKYITYRIVI